VISSHFTSSHFICCSYPCPSIHFLFNHQGCSIHVSVAPLRVSQPDTLAICAYIVFSPLYLITLRDSLTSIPPSAYHLLFTHQTCHTRHRSTIPTCLAPFLPGQSSLYISIPVLTRPFLHSVHSSMLNELHPCQPFLLLTPLSNAASTPQITWPPTAIFAFTLL